MTHWHTIKRMKIWIMIWDDGSSVSCYFVCTMLWFMQMYLWRLTPIYPLDMSVLSFTCEGCWGKQCHPQARPRDSGRPSSTSGGRLWTWSGRWPGCTCRCRWPSSQRFVWAAGPAGLGSTEGGGGHVSPLYTRVRPGPWCHAVTCPLHHWLCTWACSTCGTGHRPEIRRHENC